MTNHHDIAEDEYHGHIDWRMWLGFLKRAKRYRKNMAALMVCGVGAAIGDASFGLLTKFVIDEAVAGGQYLWHWVGAYMAAVLLLCVCVWVFIHNAGKISRYLSHDIREESFNRLQELSFSYYDTRPVGWLMSRVTSDCDRLAQIIAWGMLDMFWAGLLLILMTGVMLALNWQLALVVLAVVPLLLFVSKFFQKRILLASRRIRKTHSLLTAAYNEELMGVRTTKTLVRERDNLREFGGLSRQMYGHSMQNAMLTATYLPVVTTLGAAAAGAALWYGGGRVIAGAMTLGTLVAFMSYASQFFAPIRELAGTFTAMQGAQSAGERVMSLLTTEPEIKDSPEVEAMIEKQRSEIRGQKSEDSDASASAQSKIKTQKSKTATLAADGLPSRIDTIEFRHVGFEYKDGTRVLADFNLKVRAGQTVALVGPTGGGKSTIVNLVCRFYEPTQGELLINGVDYRKRSLHWLQSNLGIVLQTPHLFGGSIRENIRYGRLDATDDEVEQAARLVNAHEFISELEKGYDTEVGEGGVLLSTGQKQLVSFARAIIADPQVFVMDEATSSIDTETEHLIQQGVQAIMRGRLSFVIAHRLSTIRAADRILVIDAGRIVEHGTHGELIAQRGRYFDLYTSHSRLDWQTQEA